MHKIYMIILSALFISAFAFVDNNNNFSLTIKVSEFRNETGKVQFALYNEDGTIPDKNYTKYYRMLKGAIIGNTSSVTFKDLPQGKYAVNILHDENENGKVDTGFVLPKEGIGFSNYKSIGITKRPNFSKASFLLKTDTTIVIKVIYM